MGPETGKTLIILGLLLAAVGLWLHFGNKLPPIGRLPGDFSFERENVKVFLPLGSCLLISVLLTLLLWLFRR